MKRALFNYTIKSIFVLFFGLGFTFVFAQKIDTKVLQGQEGGPITTAVPFLLISPDARSGSMGDIGATTTPDAYSQNWNSAKYPFTKEYLGASFSFSPWLRNLVPDMNLYYVSGYGKIDERSTISGSLRYFSLGEVIFTQELCPECAQAYSPNEYAVDLGYARKITDEFSIGVTGRFIYSNLTMGQNVAGANTHAAMTGAADVSMFYTHDVAVETMKSSNLSIGMCVSNIGGKVSYSDHTEKDFIPTNLRIGAGYNMALDDYNAFGFYLDLNKLLVPTPAIYDSAGNVIAGMESKDISSFQGMIQSFYDAPDGFKEELKEVYWSVGAEYVYNNLFAFRMGYFNENKDKGNRKYVTMGAGIKYNTFGLDFSYLIPISQKNNPLKNTLRFSLTFDLSFLTKKGQKEGATFMSNPGM